MKKWSVFLLLALTALVVLPACGGGTAAAVTEPAGANAQQTDEADSAPASPATADNAVLTTAYQDALPVEVQLAFGTMQLDNSDLAVTAEQAETILPYWRVLQSLTQNGNAAQAEIDAVVKQIEGVMTGEQIAAIAALELTETKLQTMLEEGALSLGFGRGPGVNGDGERGGFAGGGGFPGGPPGGGAAGGPGGGPGGLGADPGAFATRQAELETGDGNPLTSLVTTASPGMVIRFLEQKTGKVPERVFGGFGTALTVVADLTGMSEEELGQAMTEGQSLTQILEDSGVPAADAREALLEAMADVPVPGDQDLEAWIDQLLSGAAADPPANS